MCTEDFIIELFVRVDAVMADVPRHQRARLYPSEVVTLALLCALKGGGGRAGYRWLDNDWRRLFPALPERTRLLRLFAAHQAWTDRFLAAPTCFGVIDSYGIELIHPARQGRSTRQIGKKGLSNRRWIVGVKLCVVLNGQGRACAWDLNTANVYDASFNPLVRRFDGEMIILSDRGFHAAADRGGDPPNLKVCRRGAWGERIAVETMLSLLTGCATPRSWPAARGGTCVPAWRTRWRCSTSWPTGVTPLTHKPPSHSSACRNSTNGYLAAPLAGRV